MNKSFPLRFCVIIVKLNNMYTKVPSFKYASLQKRYFPPIQYTSVLFCAHTLIIYFYTSP